MTNTLSSIVTATLKSYSGRLANNLTKNNSLLVRRQEKQHWADIWRKAMNNMPWQSAEELHSSYKEPEQVRALAKCLGVSYKHVARGLTEGHEPKNGEFAAKLRGFAGDYGTQLAALRLTALGVADQYHHWPENRGP